MSPEPLFDPTFRIQPPEPPTPQSKAVVVSTSDRTALVNWRGRMISARIAGPEDIEAGQPVTFVELPDPWVIKAGGQYPTRWNRPIVDFAGQAPNSVFLLYIMRENPKDFFYRPGVCLAVEGEHHLQVGCWDGQARLLKTEFAGVPTPAEAFKPGDQVLIHKKDDGTMIVIGHEAGLLVFFQEPEYSTYQTGPKVEVKVGRSGEPLDQAEVLFSKSGNAVDGVDYVIAPASQLAFPVNADEQTITVIPKYTGSEQVKEVILELLSTTAGEVDEARKVASIFILPVTEPPGGIWFVAVVMEVYGGVKYVPTQEYVRDESKYAYTLYWTPEGGFQETIESKVYPTGWPDYEWTGTAAGSGWVSGEGEYGRKFWFKTTAGDAGEYVIGVDGNKPIGASLGANAQISFTGPIP